MATRERGSAKKKGDQRKQSLYLPEEMFAWLQREAVRLDRSYSWIVQQCIRHGMARIEAMPAHRSEAAADDRP